MKEESRATRWLAMHIISVCVAAFAIAISIDMSGYKADGFLAFAHGAVILVLCMAFTMLAYQAIRNPIIKDSDIKQFNFTDHDSSILPFLFAPHAISHDPKNGITIHSVIYKCISSRFTKLLPIAFCALFFLKVTIDAGSISFINTFFLIVQSFIVMVVSFIATMTMLQVPMILRYKSMGLDGGQSGFVSQMWQLIFGKKKAKTVPAIEGSSEPNPLDKSYKADDIRIFEALKVLSTTTGQRYADLRKAAAETESEIHSISKEFDIPLESFSNELIKLNEITNVFFPTTLDSFDKTFKNTQMRTELTQVFRAKIEKNILIKIHRYEEAIEAIRIKLLETRLSPFDTSIIDGYISNLHMLHQKIKAKSGSVTNKHLVIAQNIISNLLPSLVNTWGMSDNEKDRAEVQSHFEQLVAFLEEQLSALDGSEPSGGDPLLLTLDSGTEIDSNALHQQISRNGQYIKLLKSEWR